MAITIIFGSAEEGAFEQIKTVAEEADYAALMSDGAVKKIEIREIKSK